MRFTCHATFALVVSSFLPATLAIYEDDAYNTDYHVAQLGIPRQDTTFFHRPRKDEKGSLLYTLSEKGVLGAVNPKDGSLIWRQYLTVESTSDASTEQSFLRAGEGENIIISAVRDKISSWDALTGRLVWDTVETGTTVRDLEVVELKEDVVERKDAIVLSQKGKDGVVKRLRGSDGAVKWRFVDERCVYLVLQWL